MGRFLEKVLGKLVHREGFVSYGVSSVKPSEAALEAKLPFKEVKSFTGNVYRGRKKGAEKMKKADEGVLIDNLKAAVGIMNKAIADAHNAGYTVEISTVDMNWVSDSDRRPVISATLNRKVGTV